MPFLFFCFTKLFRDRAGTLGVPDGARLLEAKSRAPSRSLWLRVPSCFFCHGISWHIHGIVYKWEMRYDNGFNGIDVIMCVYSHVIYDNFHIYNIYTYI